MTDLEDPTDSLAGISSCKRIPIGKERRQLWEMSLCRGPKQAQEPTYPKPSPPQPREQTRELAREAKFTFNSSLPPAVWTSL